MHLYLGISREITLYIYLSTGLRLRLDHRCPGRPERSDLVLPRGPRLYSPCFPSKLAICPFRVDWTW
jgi:hypothetical protein